VGASRVRQIEHTTQGTHTLDFKSNFRDTALQRPDDFMAEMAKSDDHMQKVL
jgi:hypothetical protein